MWPQPGAHTKALHGKQLGNNLQLMLTSQLVERGAGDDGDSSLVEVGFLLSSCQRKVDLCKVQIIIEGILLDDGNDGVSQRACRWPKDFCYWTHEVRPPGLIILAIVFTFTFLPIATLPYGTFTDRWTMQTSCKNWSGARILIFGKKWQPSNFAKNDYSQILQDRRICQKEWSWLAIFTCAKIFPERQFLKGWLAIAKLTPLSLFISLLLMPNEAFDNVKIEKWKVKVVSALQ